jgi:YegS/Rv2252/BmrU family lipid kinase
MKILIIYNPLAGKKSKKNRLIKKFLNNYNLEVSWHYTTEGSFTKLNPNEFDRIFAAGGDGTVKEVASWIINYNGKIPLAIIPIGSANILALSLGVPLDIKKALKFGFSAKTQKIDVGLVNHRYYFLIATGIGFDAKVIKNTSRKMKKTWGWIAYVFSLIFSFFSPKANKFFVKINDQQKTVTAQSIFISNFASFFNLTLNPNAKINDGYLNISILNTLNIRDLGILIHRFFYKKYPKDWRYEYYAAKEIYVLPFYKKTPIQIDGEIVELTHLDVKILPQALKIIAQKLP